MDNHPTLDPETLDGFLDFGRAAMAVHEVTALVTNGPPLTGEAAELHAELEVTQARLRNLFACGRDAAVSDLAPTVLVLANRTTDAIERSRSRPDW